MTISQSELDRVLSQARMPSVGDGPESAPVLKVRRFFSSRSKESSGDFSAITQEELDRIFGPPETPPRG
ncbi:MAG: hypothetical protein LBH51_00030 [Treponema sp.]|jgi:hypothetical protein|nr:hypothetical protein [Treponema sp.]